MEAHSRTGTERDLMADTAEEVGILWKFAGAAPL